MGREKWWWWGAGGAQSRGGRYSQPGRHLWEQEGWKVEEEEEREGKAEARERTVALEGHGIPGRDSALPGAGVGLVFCALQLPGLSLGIAPTAGEPLSVAWAKQVRRG